MIIGFLSGGFIGLVAVKMDIKEKYHALMNMATASFICVQTVHICCLIAHPETTGVRIAKQGSTGRKSMNKISMNWRRKKIDKR